MSKVSFVNDIEEHERGTADYFMSLIRSKRMHDIEDILKGEGMRYMRIDLDQHQRHDDITYIRQILLLTYEDVVKVLFWGIHNGKKTFIVTVFSRHKETTCCC